jgi:hypothetical protein
MNGYLNRKGGEATPAFSALIAKNSIVPPFDFCKINSFGYSLKYPFIHLSTHPFIGLSTHPFIVLSQRRVQHEDFFFQVFVASFGEDGQVVDADFPIVGIVI